MDRSEQKLVPRGGDTIDLRDEYQLHQWTEIFNISAAALHDAVDAVGPRRADVKRYLRDHGDLANFIGTRQDPGT